VHLVGFIIIIYHDARSHERLILRVFIKIEINSLTVQYFVLYERQHIAVRIEP